MPAVDMRNIFLRPSRSMLTPLSWARIKFHRAAIGSERAILGQSGRRPVGIRLPRPALMPVVLLGSVIPSWFRTGER